jgi:hypothetical protein
MRITPNKNYLIYLIWFFPVLGYLISPFSTGYPGLVWLAFLVSLVYGIIDKSTIIHSIAISGLLSPLVGSSKLFSFIPSEILVVLFFCLFIARWINNGVKIRLTFGEMGLLILLFIVILSYLFSYEYEILFKAFINYLILFFVYVLAKDSITSTSDIFRYFRTLIVVSILVSIVIKAGFDNNLILASANNGIILIQSYPDWVLFRASYFYTNIFLVLGAALIANFYINYRSLTLRLLVSILLIYTIFIMFNKTILIGLILTIVSMILINSRSILKSVGVLFLVSILILLVVINLDDKHAILTGSFSARLVIIDNAFHLLFNDTQKFLFGLGPDSTILLNNNFMKGIKDLQGTIDSGFMVYFVEFGLIFLLIFLWLIFMHIIKFIGLRCSTLNLSILSKVFLGILILVTLSLFTQRMGSSKVMWIFIQILALSNVFLNMRYKKGS